MHDNNIYLINNRLIDVLVLFTYAKQLTNYTQSLRTKIAFMLNRR